MQHGRIGRTRWVRNLAVSTAAACAVLAASASAAFAWSYTAVVSPPSVASGSSTTFNVALTNTSGGNPLNSAIIRPPGRFDLTGAALTPGESGTVELDPKRVVLRGLSLAPGQSANVSVTATAPSKCKTFNWHTHAFSKGLQSQELDLNSWSSLTTTVTCATATALEFTGQPNNALINDDITGTSYSTSGPPLKVELVDASGNIVDSSAPVTIALVNPPGGTATLGGTTTEDAVDGVATFSDLTVANSNNGYTLTASSPGLTSADSTPFDISDGVTNCNTTEDCLLTLTGSESTLAIDASPNDGQLNGQVDPGTPLDGPGSNPKLDPGCAGYTPQNLDWYGFNLTSNWATTRGRPPRP